MKKIANFCVVKDVIRKILQDELKKPGRPSLQDFAGSLNISYRTLYNVMQGKSTLTFEQVMKAGEILDIDIVAKYNGNQNITYENTTNKIESDFMTITLNIKGPEQNVLNNISSLLKEIKEKATQFGLLIN
ncbi:hypothetical protein DBR40_24875 [Pedobacter sp. KBW01]|uniref:helix-turn-helix domain-containing protein n=1 Tax=Pedobacter sp. KBW01 TaxID=2153364 RepID=UPI000F5A545C|nr:helix-turn-helix transcriptional regulator [Pedobacter sp. KBW01]RQO65108.1 hypothetical protein DBR40_24875 [Pedobacter sp. KBW01]